MNSFLRLNPQIKVLSMPYLKDETFLDSLSEHLPLLESLEFRGAPTHFYNFRGHFGNLKRLKIKMNAQIQIRTNFVITVPQLEILEWESSISFMVNFDCLYEFLSKNPSIVRIKAVGGSFKLWPCCQY